MLSTTHGMEKAMSDVTLAKSERVYRELRSRIISGRYVPGYRIVLDHVARELGVSPVPVREAIRRLEAEKLIVFVRNVGAEVASINVDDYVETMQLVAYLEGAATSLAMTQLTEDQLSEAAGLNDELRDLAKGNFDPRVFTVLNQSFHEVLCGACPNEVLLEMLQRTWERIAVIRRTAFAFEPVRSQTSVDEHDQILSLLRDGNDAAAVELAARNHKLRTMRQFAESPPN